MLETSSGRPLSAGDRQSSMKGCFSNIVSEVCSEVGRGLEAGVKSVATWRMTYTSRIFELLGYLKTGGWREDPFGTLTVR